MCGLTLPPTKEQRLALHAGDCIALSGTVFTARDCAHQRIFEALDAGMVPPFPLKDTFIYYAGPSPAPCGKPSGSVGPTTSARMNAFAPRLLALGLGGMIGKGEMSEEVRRALMDAGAVYLAAIGGAGAFYGSAVRSSELVAYPDLRAEGVFRLEIEKFPLVVAIDAHGNSIYVR